MARKTRSQNSCVPHKGCLEMGVACGITLKYATKDDVVREAFHALQHADEEVAAIQASLDEWQDGDEGLPLDEAFDEIRKSIREGGSP